MNLLFHTKNVLLLLTNVASYMIKIRSSIKKNLFILSACLAHAIRCVAETARFWFPGIDELIATLKKLSLKAPSRVGLRRIILRARG